MIGWNILDFSSETDERNSTKVKWKQDLNILYLICVFRADRKKKTKIKYNNAKRSIPAHPTFVNDAHLDFQLWQVTSKSNGVHHLTMVIISAKFDE